MPIIAQRKSFLHAQNGLRCSPKTRRDRVGMRSPTRSLCARDLAARVGLFALAASSAASAGLTRQHRARSRAAGDRATDHAPGTAARPLDSSPRAPSPGIPKKTLGVSGLTDERRKLGEDSLDVGDSISRSIRKRGPHAQATHTHAALRCRAAAWRFALALPCTCLLKRARRKCATTRRIRAPRPRGS